MPELTLNIKYDGTRFDVATIRRMLDHVRTLLEAIAANPNQRLVDLPLLTIEESKRLLIEWNDTAVDYPQGQTLHELFAEQVSRTPDTTALIFGEERLSYSELDRRATRLASYLRAQGVGPEVLVGVCMERSVEMIVALLGILKAGGAYVALDPAYPSERWPFMLEDSDVRLLITQQWLFEKLPAAFETLSEEFFADSLRSLRLCVKRSVSRKDAEKAKDAKADPANLAYVIYTSGSTGKPKGVAITHHSAVTLVHWAKENFTAENYPEYASGHIDHLRSVSVRDVCPAERRRHGDSRRECVATT